MSKQPLQEGRGKEKDPVFRLLYGFSILYVVVAHFGRPIGLGMLESIFSTYTFALFAFTFSSGYFYRKSDEEHPVKAILHKVRRLVVPMYLYNFFYAFAILVSRRFGFIIGEEVTWRSLLIEPWTFGHQYMYNLGGWFVAPLFMVYVCNLLVRKILGKFGDDRLVFVLYQLLGMYGIWLTLQQFNHSGYGLAICRFLIFLPLYGLGTLYRNYLEKYDTLNNYLYFGVLIMIQILMNTAHGYVRPYYYSWCDNFDNVFCPYIVGYVGVFFLLRFCKWLSPIIPSKGIMSQIGDCSYSVMMNHFLGFMVVKSIFAVLFKVSSGVWFGDFNMDLYKADVWYFYLPKGLDQWGIVYIAAGVGVAILIQKLLNLAKTKIKKTVPAVQKFIF